MSNFNYTPDQLADICDATLTGNMSQQWTRTVSRLIIDSRSPIVDLDVMFCAIKGAADGHLYVGQMYDRGVRVFLVGHDFETGRYPEALFLVVKDVEQAIIAIAEDRRAPLSDTTFIGITGSVGKTVVKELLYKALLSKAVVERSPRSWNSRLGVPLSICSFDSDDKFAIVEVGIDHAGSMAALERLVRPAIGILTPITAEHDSGFASRDEKIREKVKLFKDSKFIIYSHADDVEQILTEECPDAVLIAVTGDFNINAVDEVTQLLGYKCSDLDNHEPTNRLDVHEGINDCVIILDDFTADVESMRHALDFMHRRAASPRKATVIMTDLLQPCGTDPIQIYETAAALLHAADVTRLITIGTEAINYSGLFHNIEVDNIPTTDAFLDSYDINDFSGETILVFGHPYDAMQRIATLLAAPRHDTTLDINLDALVHNFNYYRSLVKPTTGMIAMVKASAYGVGAVEVAKTLQAQGASYLAVAVIDEGIELRRGGVTMPILVLNPITANFRALFDYGLQPAVFSLRELEALREAARRAGIGTFDVHIKLDTGMHRVGFTEPELPGLIDALREADDVRVSTVFSHLATADCPDLNDYTRGQIDLFGRMSSEIIAALPYPVKRHLLNTAGIVRFPDAQYDYVRLGIGLYGISPLESSEGLNTVATLKTTIISLHSWQPGDTVGYGCKGKITRPSLIATVPVGYADGLNRHLGNGAAKFVVRGVECPTIGNICMDLCMVDVTDVPGVSIGDEVEIFGRQMPIGLIAHTLDTIPYEVLASVAPRVKRVYFRD